MSVTTYVGFSIVSLMCIAWLVLPFKSLKLRWPLGTGLRNTIGLDGTNFRHILNDFLAFQIGDFTIPTGLIAASAILIGGASTSRCKISHVLIGTFLFQGVLTLGMPVANVLVPGSTISETLRILISNGIILYALTKSGGESRA